MSRIYTDDDEWWSHYMNAAERMFGKTDGDTLTENQDEACIADANARTADTRQEKPVMSTTAGPHDCTCGYAGTSASDLDEHLIAAAPLDPEGTHRPARTT